MVGMNYEPYVFAMLGYLAGPALIYGPIYGVIVAREWVKRRKYALKLTYEPAQGFIDLMKYPALISGSDSSTHQ